MAGDGQQSSEHSTRNGIQALESAFSGIMNQSLVQHNKTQGSSNDQINQAYSASQSAFDQLAG
jgi:hypothetical protein